MPQPNFAFWCCLASQNLVRPLPLSCSSKFSGHAIEEGSTVLYLAETDTVPEDPSQKDPDVTFPVRSLRRSSLHGSVQY